MCQNRNANMTVVLKRRVQFSVLGRNPLLSAIDKQATFMVIYVRSD